MKHAGAAGLLAAPRQPPPRMPRDRTSSLSTQIERGRYLALARRLHALPHRARRRAARRRRRPSRRRSARSSSPNITPDRETGIGGWTDDEFVNAVQGRHRARRHAPLSGDALHLLHTR